MLNRMSLNNLVDKKDLVGAEVGVAEGTNASNIFNNLSIKRMYLIDPYNNLNGTEKEKRIMRVPGTSRESQAKKSLIPFKEKIIWIHKLSHDAIYDISEELDFVYIDGNHYYENVKKDAELYYTKVKIGGLLCGHDYDQSNRSIDHGCNVKKAIDEFVEENGLKLFTHKNHDVGVDWWVFRG